MMNRCVNQLCPEIIEPEITPEKASEYIFKKYPEIFEMPEKYTIKGINILGKPPLYVGISRKKREIVFYFNKPCFGTMLLKIKGTEEDFENIISQGKPIDKNQRI